MSHSPQEPLVSEAALQELDQRGQAIYAAKRELLEPEHTNRYVAIHVDSGDLEVASSSAQAARAIQVRHPLDGRLYIRKIGSEPEYGLASRLLMGEMMTTAQK